MIQTQILRSWKGDLSVPFHNLFQILSQLQIFSIRILNISVDNFLGNKQNAIHPKLGKHLRLHLLAKI